MIREIATRKSSTGYKGLLIIVFIAVMIIAMSTLVGFIENNFGIKNLEYIIYFILLGLAIFVIQYFVTQYRYSLFDDELIIERMLGNKITPIVSVFIWDIISFEKVAKDNGKDKEKISKSYNLFVQHSNRWSLIYKKDEEFLEAVFSPSEDFIRQLKRAINGRQHKEQREPNIIT